VSGVWKAESMNRYQVRITQEFITYAEDGEQAKLRAVYFLRQENPACVINECVVEQLPPQDNSRVEVDRR